MDDYDISAKVLIIGDTEVGKSCILIKYVNGKFPQNYPATVGVDY